MVEITLITNAGKKKDVVSENMTVRQIYDKFNVNYESCTNTVDSVPLRIGDLDRSLRELGVGETVRMSSIVKNDNAAEIIVAGTAAVVKSAIKLDVWEKCLKYDPDLGVYNEENEPLFKVAIEPGSGSLNKHGVVFSSVPTDDGYACVTVALDPEEENKIELVREMMGRDLLSLIELEEGLPNVIKESEEADRKIQDKIKSI